MSNQRKTKGPKYVSYDWESVDMPWNRVAKALYVNAATLYRWRVRGIAPALVVPILETLKENGFPILKEHAKKEPAKTGVDFWLKKFNDACREKDLAEQGLRDAIRNAEYIAEQRSYSAESRM